MPMCSRCHKRIAVVFMRRMDNNNTVEEGFCLKCAKELGIGPVNDILSKMGLSEEDFDAMSNELSGLMEGGLPDADGEEGGAPAINIPAILQGLMGGMGQAPSSSKDGKQGKKEKVEKPKYKYLEAYCRNLTKRAALGELDNIVGRERELDRVVQILCRRQKNNPCLIGDPGVGKTAIAEALAQRIVAGNVPFRLKDCEVWLVDLTALVAGTQFRGQFESRVLGLVNDVKAAKNAILVIDEIHNIVGAGDAEGGMNAANILKPALSRGEIQVIGATTMEEYRKYIEKDSALERRFQPVVVKEPSIAESIEILRGIKKYYEVYHGVKIPDEAIVAAVRLSERYITDRFLPDKAIDLLDEAAAHISLSCRELNERKALAAEMAALAKSKDELTARLEKEEEGEGGKEELYRALADIKSKEMQQQATLERLDALCQAVCLTENDIADVIEIWTGIPANTISADEFKRLDGLEERLLERIVGQDKAVAAIVRTVKRKRAGISYNRAPVSFIFAGPTGVGKTELVKALAEDLFNQPESLIRLDMSEYMEKHAVSRIIGAPPGYVGFDDAGQLTEKIRRRPYSVILFDEIEKAHPDVMNILLQILDEGMITDAHGKKVNFENTVIVMTTNAGSETSAAISGFSTKKEELNEEKTMRALSSFLRPEFLNRVDGVITFRHLSVDDFVSIVKIQIKKLKAALAERGISLNVTENASKLIAEASYSEKYGARNMRRYIQTEIEDRLAQIIISHYEDKPTKASVTVKDGKLCVSAL